MKNTGLKRGVYKVTTENDVVVFVGGTTSTLKQVEWNHQNNNPLDSEGAEKFRHDLNKFGGAWTFSWEHQPTVSTPEQNASLVEKAIKKYVPFLNL